MSVDPQSDLGIEADICLAARAYAEAGWSLVPIDRARKGPTFRGWNLPQRCIRAFRRAGVLLAGWGCMRVHPSGSLSLGRGLRVSLSPRNASTLPCGAP